MSDGAVEKRRGHRAVRSTVHFRSFPPSPARPQPRPALREQPARHRSAAVMGENAACSCLCFSVPLLPALSCMSGRRGTGGLLSSVNMGRAGAVAPGRCAIPGRFAMPGVFRAIRCVDGHRVHDNARGGVGCTGHHPVVFRDAPVARHSAG
eukprot:349816-Chlamydomonas_euryale.AAC.5